MKEQDVEEELEWESYMTEVAVGCKIACFTLVCADFIFKCKRKLAAIS
jgi:hypothetical protein